MHCRQPDDGLLSEACASGLCTQAQPGSGSLEISSCDDCETAAMRRGEAGAMKPAAEHRADSIRVARSMLSDGGGGAESRD